MEGPSRWVIPDQTERTLTFPENDAVRALAGEFGAHLKMVGRAFSLEVAQRGAQIRVGPGNPPDVDAACKLLQGLYALVEKNYSLRPADVEQAIRTVRGDPTADVANLFTESVVTGAAGRPISPRTPGQRRYVEALRTNDIVLGVGPAGTGKTYLAMAMAVAALVRGDVRRIVLTRPAVEAGEKLGFLPGDLAEKVDPYLRPLFDAMNDMLPAERVQRLMEKKAVEVAPLAFMRGRTLNDAYIVLDEAQNTTVEQMKMFLTRLGEGSKMIVTGDITQIDLPPGRTSGLVHALGILEDIERIGIVRFGVEDVVRHPLVGAIVAAYDRQRRVP
jgi:phosphate starvation-inducible PhoH-like protein